MKYHAPTKMLVIDPQALEHVALLCRYAIRHIREASNLDPAGYEWHGMMEHAQHAEKTVIEIAEALDIDLGTPADGRLSFGDLDVRDAK